MVDGALLLVDAAEGPMAQTKFVLTKALARGLCPIVVVNKVDKPDGRPDEVVNEVFDLFVALDATEEQLDFPVIFASAKEGWAATGLDDPRDTLEPLFEAISARVPLPVAEKDAPFQMLATTLEADPYLGRILTGRIHSGRAKVNMTVRVLSRDGKVLETGRLSKLLAFRGLKRVPVDEAEAGDIIAIAGLTNATVADTLAAPEITEALPSREVSPPTMAVTFAVNDSPLAGLDGSKVTGRMIGERLMREAEGNVAIRINETAERDAYEVAGRGELQIGVLIETMRREGFELSISRPRVIYQNDAESGQRMEPIEEVVVDVDQEYAGAVVEKIGMRRGEMTDMRPSGGGKTRVTFMVPSRGLIGYHGEFLTDTRGTGVMTRLFHGYAPYKGAIAGRREGSMIANSQGKAAAYALWNLEERGRLLVEPGEEVYEGMIIGENAKGNDLDVNPLKGKQLTNMRASGKDEAVRLTPIAKMSLEDAVAYIADDERVEVTPNYIRLRKAFLNPHDRKREQRRRDDTAG
jgi:GTP-binding protein